MEKKERVILIKGDDSQWYEQAIFIVKPNTPKDKIPKDFVAEAEKIIHNHVRKKYGKNSANNNVGIAYATSSSANKTATPTHNQLYAKVPQAGNQHKPIKKKANRSLDFILNSLMAIGCIVIAGALIWGVFG